MKRLAALAVFAGLATTSVWAQSPHIWTSPATPAQGALDRLNLRMDWRARLPIEGFRDGVATIQNLGDMIIVQARDGSVTAFDPISGGAKWYVRFERSYPITHNVGYNDTLVLVANGTKIYGLDRAAGTKLWWVDLAASPASPPTADATAFYICLNNGRLAAYAYPIEPPPPPPSSPSSGSTASTGKSKPAAPAATGVAPAVRTAGPRATPAAAQPTAAPAGTKSSGANTGPSATSARSATVTGGVDARSAATAVTATAGRSAVGGSQLNRTGRGATVQNTPKLLWDFQTHLRISERPLVTEKGIIVVSTGREAVFVDKTGNRPLEFKADAEFSAPVGQFGDTVYAACINGSIYAFHLPSRTVVWQATANGPVTAQPMATDEDLFVTSDRGGVIRYLRANGQLVWQNPEAVQFVASNPKFVYSLDRIGRLLVIDRMQGKTLTSMDMRDFIVNLANQDTDRLILGANDGTVMSLHDRDYLTPLKMNVPLQPVAPPPPTEKPRTLEDIKVPDSKDK